jgi:hypothetical protein
MSEQRIPCPDCGNANRHARRRCKANGGMCGGKGWVVKTIADPADERTATVWDWPGKAAARSRGADSTEERE